MALRVTQWASQETFKRVVLSEGWKGGPGGSSIGSTELLLDLSNTGGTRTAQRSAPLGISLQGHQAPVINPMWARKSQCKVVAFYLPKTKLYENTRMLIL